MNIVDLLDEHSRAPCRRLIMDDRGLREETDAEFRARILADLKKQNPLDTKNQKR